MATVDLESLVYAGIQGATSDATRLLIVDNYLHGIHEGPYLPPKASPEYRLLAKRAIANWMPLLVDTPAHALAVSGYRKSDSKDDVSSPEWQTWQSNRMDSRQNAVHHAAIGYGQSFVTKRRDPITGEFIIRGVSPRKMYASYVDPASDDLPLWALQLDNPADPKIENISTTGHLWTDTHVTEVSITSGAGGITVGSKTVVGIGKSVPHGMTLNGKPVCPVVRFAPDIDLEGRVRGVVEPLIPMQNRINQTVFDRLVVQTFSSFKVRTVSGMAPPLKMGEDGTPELDDNGQPIPLPIRADASRFLVASDPDTKFGTLDETPMDGFLAAYESDIKTLAAVSQTPPHYLLGSIVNLSAEALAAAEAALTRSVTGYQFSMGESWELVLGLGSSQYDPRAQIIWNDYESRSLSQTVDALGKAAQMLQVPPRALWTRIPGVSTTDVEQWTDMQSADDTTSRIAENALNALNRTPPANDSQAVPDGE